MSYERLPTRPRGVWPILPVARWPASHQLLWNSACARENPVRRGRAANLAEPTRRMLVENYGAFLHWLQGQGELDMTSDPEALMTPELLDGFIVSRRRTVSDNTTYNNLRMLRLMMSCLCPGVDWTWIGRQGVAPRLWEAKAARRKPRQFPVAFLLAKLIDAMRQVIDQPTDLKSSIRMRDCLIVAVGVITSLRLRNLTNMRLERNLIRRTTDWEILFDRAEMKNGEPFLSHLPEVFCPMVERYITVERVRLAAGREVPTDAVWPSQKGGSLGRAAIRLIFAQIGTEFLGYPINPHATRSVMATRILTDDPRALTTASLALSHSDTSTVTQFYDESGPRLAQEKYAELMERTRNEARKIRGDAIESGRSMSIHPNPSYSPHSRDSLTGMVQTSGIA